MDKLKQSVFASVRPKTIRKMSRDTLQHSRDEVEGFYRSCMSLQKWTVNFNRSLFTIDDTYLDYKSALSDLQQTFGQTSVLGEASGGCIDTIEVFASERSRLSGDIEALKCLCQSLLTRIGDALRKLESRDQQWQTLEHYKAKLEKLRSSRDHLTSNNKSIGTKLQEKLSRNELKHANAILSFERVDSDCRSEVNALLTARDSDLRPILAQTMILTSQYFTTLGGKMGSLKHPIDLLRGVDFAGTGGSTAPPPPPPQAISQRKLPVLPATTNGISAWMPNGSQRNEDLPPPYGGIDELDGILNVNSPRRPTPQPKAEEPVFSMKWTQSASPGHQPQRQAMLA